MKYSFLLTGKFKPYVRMTQRGKWVRPEAQEYLDSKATLQRQMQMQMSIMDWNLLPGQTPLRVYIQIHHRSAFHNRDLDNEIKALLDSAQGVVFPDDRWIDSITAMRKCKPPGDPLAGCTFFTVEPLEDNHGRDIVG